MRPSARSTAQAVARACEQQTAALQSSLPTAQAGVAVSLITHGGNSCTMPTPAGLSARSAVLAASGMSLAAMQRVAAAENPGLRWVKLDAIAEAATSAVQTLTDGALNPALLAAAATADGHGQLLSAGAWLSPKLVARPQAPPSAALAAASASVNLPGAILITGKRHILALTAVNTPISSKTSGTLERYVWGAKTLP